MTDKHVLDADAAFFAALLAADSTALDGLLAADFLLVDVLAGQVVARDMFLDLVGSRRLEFVEVLTDPGQASVRERPGLGVVLGRTRMTMRFDGAEVVADSRYIHVFVADGGAWRLLAAQGTPDTGAANP
jgi:hypothetical protein